MSRESCSCEKCTRACRRRPCWGTPEDAKKLIEAGFAHRLMDDYWLGDGPGDSDIHLLCPACVGYEGRAAPEVSVVVVNLACHTNPFGRCTFLDGDNRCELHDKKLKPLEGRRYWCEEPRGEALARHERCAMVWNNEEARALVERWREEVSK